MSEPFCLSLAIEKQESLAESFELPCSDKRLCNISTISEIVSVASFTLIDS